MRSKSNYLNLFLKIILIFFPIGIYAQNYHSELNLKLDNDYYVSSDLDRYYTHGSFLNFRHSLKLDSVKSPFLKKIVELELGQKIYNPYWSNAPDVKKHDRPFAGYAYLAAGINWFGKKNNLIKANVQLGILGPASQAEKVQTAFHNFLNAYYGVKGWEYQVKNELILNLEMAYIKEIINLKKSFFDIHYLGQAHLGNFNTNLQTGAIFRLGKLNQIAQSSLFSSRLGRENNKAPFEIFFVYQPQINLALYDASIQGGLFRSDKGPVTYAIRPLVFQQVLGFYSAYQRFAFKYLVTFKSREVKSSATPYYYGSISLSYLFR